MAPAWHSTAIRSVWNFDCFRFAAQVRPGAKGPPPPPTHTHTHTRTQQNAAKQLRLSARMRQTRLLPPHRSAGYLRVKRIPASVRQTLESGRSFRCCSSPGARVLAAETGTPGLFRSNSVVARAWHSRQCRSCSKLLTIASSRRLTLAMSRIRSGDAAVKTSGSSVKWVPLQHLRKSCAHPYFRKQTSIQR